MAQPMLMGYGNAAPAEAPTLEVSEGSQDSEVSEALVEESDTPSAIPVVGWRWSRKLSKIYAFNDSPTGDRTPLILVPGRAEEYQHHGWWKKFRQDFDKDNTLRAHYKLYVYLYDSKVDLGEQVEPFVRDMRTLLGELPDQRPTVLISYSLGGLIAREAMEQDDLFSRVDTIFAIAVPFHGTPLFDPKWFRGFISHVSPIRQYWDKILYQVYIWDKSNLINGMSWNNFDCSQPSFDTDSTLTLGDTVVAPTIRAYTERSSTSAYKAKTIVYASFLENKYTKTSHSGLLVSMGKVIAGSRFLPKAVISSLLPFYGITVHDVFTYTNNQLSNLPTFTPEYPEGKNIHLYRYNDGAIPLSSALYLPGRCKPYSGNLEQLLDNIDVAKARVFVNIDHVDLGHYRVNWRLGHISAIDVREPKLGRKTPNQWLALDLKQRLHDLQPPPPKHTVQQSPPPVGEASSR